MRPRCPSCHPSHCPPLCNPPQGDSRGAIAFLRQLGPDLSQVTRLGGHSVPRTHSNAAPGGPNIGLALVKAAAGQLAKQGGSITLVTGAKARGRGMAHSSRRAMGHQLCGNRLPAGMGHQLCGNRPCSTDSAPIECALRRADSGARPCTQNPTCRSPASTAPREASFSSATPTRPRRARPASSSWRRMRWCWPPAALRPAGSCCRCGPAFAFLHCQQASTAVAQAGTPATVTSSR